MIKAIIFDFDYTLGDSAKGIALSINYALNKLGYPAPDIEAVIRTIGLSLTETYLALTSDDDLYKAEQFAKFFKEEADKVMVANTSLYPGVKMVLQHMKAKGYKTAVVTTKYHYRIEQILSKFHANELIDIIVGAEDVKIEKPNPEGLLWAIEHLGVRKEEALYVGDSIVDAKTAENAGVKFAAVVTGTTTREDFRSYNSVYTGNSISDVCEYVFALK